MPHHHDDQRHAHLPLVREEPNPQRRSPKVVPPPTPARGGRTAFGGQLRTRVRTLEEQAQALPPKPAGVDPRLVFRVPLALRANILSVIAALERAGIEVIGTEPDNAIIAFRNDLSLTALREALEVYEAGPQKGINPNTKKPYASTVWDVLEWIEVDQMAVWSRPDRIGQKLAAVIGPTGANIDLTATYVLDLELWYRGSRQLAQQTIKELRRMIIKEDQTGRLLDEFVGDLVCLAKVSVPGAVLGQLLDWEMVAEAEYPPVPVLDFSAVNREVASNFPAPARPSPDGPRVCVLDSGLTLNHPLLANHIGHADAVLTVATAPDDDTGHGTLVGGIAVFGDVRAAHAAGRFHSEVLLFSGRVLNSANGFDDEQLIVTQMGRAIEMFVAEPHRCRVFNLSLGGDEPWLRDNRRQSMWAESLDLLARRHKVMIVVSAGNQGLGVADSQADAEAVLTNYPRYLFEPECGLNEPATAAIAVTVGGIALHTEPAVRRGVNAENVCRAVAGAEEPTPTTRIGPGLAKAMKPEFVAHAGNCLVDGFSANHVIRKKETQD